MSAVTECYITGLGLYTPHHPNVQGWREGPSSDAAPPRGDGLDRRNLRRASPFTRALADVASAAIAQAGADPTTLSTVFGSAIGEGSTMIGLLDQMWRHAGPLSPMKFALSVHNAASGMYSISSENQGFATSVAADYETPAMALLEGLGASVAFGTPALVVCGDEAAPVDLVPEGERFGLLAAALTLHAGADGGDALARLRGPYLGVPTTPGAQVPDALARNPQIGLLDLVDCVLQGRWGTLRLDRGRGRGWCVDVLAPARQ